MAQYIDFQKLKDRVPIDAVATKMLGLNLKLQENGVDYVGDCPMCGEGDEDSTRFKVTVEKGAFHCFNCKEGGNMIELVAKVQDVTLPAAARRIADEFNITDCTYKRSSKKTSAADSEPDNDVNELIDEFVEPERAGMLELMPLGDALRRLKNGNLDEANLRVIDISPFRI